MGISGCLDQLHVHAHGVTALLHAAFQNVGNAKLLGDLPQILRRALIVLGRSARDDLQIGDLGQSGQNLVLDPIGEVGVRSIVTEVFKGRTAIDLRSISGAGGACFPCSIACCECNNRDSISPVAAAATTTTTAVSLRPVLRATLRSTSFSRLIPSGVSSNAQERTSAMGNPITSATTTISTAQFGISKNGN